MNESVKKWLEEKRAELAGRRDVAIFIEAKDVLDAIVLTEQFKFVGSNANCPEPQNTDAQVERRRARETR